MTEPEYATLRDLVATVDKVDTKLDDHRIDVERRIGRLEKAMLALAAVVLIPKIGGTDAATLATHVAVVVTHHL